MWKTEALSNLPTVGFTGVKEVQDREPLPSKRVDRLFKEAWKE